MSGLKCFVTLKVKTPLRKSRINQKWIYQIIESEGEFLELLDGTIRSKMFQIIRIQLILICVSVDHLGLY